MNDIYKVITSSPTAQEVTRTVVFADLTGSTGIYESMGNARATALITMLTKWLSELCVEHHGEVVKVMGVGVLMTFSDAQDALEAAVSMQRTHVSNLARFPTALSPHIKVGIAHGQVVRHASECYGDAVNVASGLCDRAGPDQVLVDDAAFDGISHHLIRLRPMGPVSIPGRSATCNAQRLEWQDDVATAFLTMQGPLGDETFVDSKASEQRLQLRFGDSQLIVSKLELPIFLGRGDSCALVIPDPRVSRVHATIEWNNSVYSLRDTSSYGTWVRFRETDSTIALRRQHCPLHGQGEIALGASFSSENVPTISFAFLGN